jgi:Family of unknown function (DUF6879)
MEPLSYEKFKALAAICGRAFHLEQRDTYNVAAEDVPFGRWLRGESDDYAWHQDWLAFLRQATAAGVQIQRVRLVSLPYTDYTRWGLHVARLNVEAGEDIRYLPRELAKDIDLPAEDYWLLDDDTLILSVFSADGRTGCFTHETSPELVQQCRLVRDQVWGRAIPYAQYVA